ncbi:NADPH-dependent FMN reductase [Maribacter hydrothermalis]|uniref:NADPH-dependent FMN reductase n=1 Tax=Maribacter hydrothermalis TaxID=1836467 RepID=A0A1B7Z6J6_9FLAO|nr:NAD(P)H-dependent oxidoreductase [Maribacter hydrothermalis]APQ18655.1 NADPH-dependent FMN reductase [Maribacter hydrothermalis]OBR38352.1 NADPH-dependent FMN reductase [Maribacter hydrothermalis]
MSYVLAFAGSNSSVSINYKLTKYTTTLLNNTEVHVRDMARYPFPMYSEDAEKENGFSNSLIEFKNEISNATGLIISVNEHNSYPSAYFKNVIDWLSRLDKQFLIDKKILLMATSNGGRGGAGALEAAENMLTRFKGEVVETFSLPKYSENFDEQKGIINTELAKIHSEKVSAFLKAIS